MIGNYKCVVVANGLFPAGEWALKMLHNAEFVIACDGAALSLLRNGIRPNVIVGDLDSLPEEFCKTYAGCLLCVADQEINDLTKAVRHARDLEFKEVLILGATGLREDHTLGNISLLAEYISDFDRIEMLSDYGLFTPITQNTTFSSYPGQQISLFSLYPHGAISVTGLRYPIENRRLLYLWEGTLNEALGTGFTITLNEEGSLIVYRQLPLFA